MNRKQRRAAAKIRQRQSDSRVDATTVAGLVITELWAAGVQHHRAGRLAEAEACYRRMLTAQPNNADAFTNLGVALKGLGRLDEAVAAYRQAIAINPDCAEAHSNLGNALRDRGELDEAVTAYREAVRVKPDYAEAHSNLGNALRDQGELDEAVRAYREAVHVKPDFAEAHSNLGNVLTELGKLDEAVGACRQAVGINSNYAEFHSNLGNALNCQGKHDEAITAYREAIRVKADYAEAHSNLGNALRDRGELDEAVGACRQAIGIKPNYAGAHFNLGNALRDLGRFEEAHSAYKKAIDLAPRSPLFYFNLVTMKQIAPGDPELLAMEKLASDPKLVSINDRIYLHFALGKAYGDLKDHERSFQHLLEGNALQRQQLSYSDSTERILSERIREAFTPALMRDKRGLGEPSRTPVFIVGMPRSGTTLIEQVLASHPKVFGGGERVEFAEAAASLRGPESAATEFPEVVTGLDGQQLREFGARYVTAVQRLAPNAERITDKMPGNYRRVGLINLALPNARVIHARRDPLDTCLSCFSNLFARDHHPYCYDLTELGHVYRNYEALMAHWRRVLPPEVLLDVQYEEVVADLEGQARRIMAHCGLEWDDRCLSFHQTKRPVQTLSTIAVRQPIYQSSVGRWRAHEQQLGPLIEALRAGGGRLPNLDAAVAQGRSHGLTVMVKPTTAPNTPSGQPG
jgi:tetratricopeptide (TPR) repeat protein